MAKRSKKEILKTLSLEITKSKLYITQLEDGLKRHTDQQKKSMSHSAIGILKQTIARLNKEMERLK